MYVRALPQLLSFAQLMPRRVGEFLMSMMGTSGMRKVVGVAKQPPLAPAVESRV
jgi:hypothetical protein